MPTTSLPSFENPPVIETILGVQFEPIRGLSAGHLGAFWKRLQSHDPSGESWCRLADAPALEPTFETFAKGQRWLPNALRVTFGQPPPTRLQVRNEPGDAMVQIQNGRLHYNWIRKSDADYPRYSKIRPRFDWLVGEFCAFFEGEGLGGMSPNQWEITYVNHIPKGPLWSEPTDWGTRVLSVLGDSPLKSEVAQLESVAATWHLEIPPQRGRLHIDLKHAYGGDDPAAEILRLTLTARGAVDADRALNAGLDLGHEAIVRTFKEITAPPAHEVWGLKK